MHIEEVVQRFHLEFDILARLDHPGVLRVFEAGDIDGRPYIVMEFLDGVELGRAVETWKDIQPAERFQKARDALVSVATALEYVHGQGLVHRDVTPSNVMLLRDGSVRLMDFGVVKEPGADLTSVGEVVGTAAYIAPEQITGARVDARTDLYGLGAVLYLMLTGRRPFSARTLAGYLDKHSTVLFGRRGSWSPPCPRRTERHLCSSAGEGSSRAVWLEQSPPACARRAGGQR